MTTATDKPVRRAVLGTVSGVAGTVALTGFRKAMERFGMLFETAPERVVDRLQTLGALPRHGGQTRRVMVQFAHFAYGTGAGTVFGLLRTHRSGLLSEVAVGSALGVLVWGTGWSTWLPLLRVESAPWRWESPDVLLPVVDHAAFGAAWGAAHWALLASTTERSGSANSSGHRQSQLVSR